MLGTCRLCMPGSAAVHSRVAEGTSSTYDSSQLGLLDEMSGAVQCWLHPWLCMGCTSPAVIDTLQAVLVMPVLGCANVTKALGCAIADLLLELLCMKGVVQPSLGQAPATLPVLRLQAWM